MIYASHYSYIAIFIISYLPVVTNWWSHYSLYVWSFVWKQDDIIKWEHFPQYWLSTGKRWSPVNCTHRRPVMRSFDVSFAVTLNKLLNIQSNCWWFEIPKSICDAIAMNSMRGGPLLIECICTLNLSIYWHAIEMHIATPKWYSFCCLIYQQWFAVLVLPDLQQTWSWPFKSQTNGLVQGCSNSIANTLELLQSCTKPLIFHLQGRDMI